MDLWEKYAEKVRRFEPTKRWEESALLFGIIQGMRLKNQLFNYNWAQSRKPEPVGDIDLAALTVPSRTPVGDVPPTAAKEPGETPEKSSRTGKVLKLQPKKK